MVLFVWGFNFLKGKTILKTQPYYYAIYDNVDGLQQANQVLINGLIVGQVDELTLQQENHNRILVRFSVNNNDIKIPQNSIAYISSDLMGSKSINLVLGNSLSYAIAGDTLTADLESGTMDMIKSQIGPVKDKIESLVMSLDTLAKSINVLIDEGLSNDIKSGVHNFSVTFANLEKTSADLKSIVNSEQDSFVNIINDFELIAANLTAISDSLSQISYTRLSTSLEKTINDLDSVIYDINKGEGNLGLMIKDDSLYYNVNEAVTSLQNLLEAIKKDPKKYIKVSVF